jgi:hypothetical protein
METHYQRTKNQIKIDGWNHHTKDKRERQKGRSTGGQQRHSQQEPKKGLKEPNKG